MSHTTQVSFYCDRGQHAVTATVAAYGNGLPLFTGYGVDRETGAKACHECCAVADREAMTQTGRATMYLTKDGVTNWPGSLRFPVRQMRVGRHNIARVRYDFRFTGPDGAEWAGVQYGDNTQPRL
jgi:hypothetical protein